MLLLVLTLNILFLVVLGEASNSSSILNDYEQFLNEEVASKIFSRELEQEDHAANINFENEHKAKQNLFAALTPLYLPKLDEDKLSDKCYKDVQKIHRAFSGNIYTLAANPWALKLFDSWGKFEDGILMGNHRLMGFFDECLSINGSSEILGQEPLKGKYCFNKYAKKQNEVEQRMPQILIPLKLDFLVDAYATCMPASCTTKELYDSVNLSLNSSDVSVYSVNCQTSDEKVDFDASQIFGICFFSIIIFILIVASLFDLVSAKLSKTILRKKMAVLLAFSMPQNFSKIITLDTNPSPDTITCIHGIRVISIFWVIWMHQYLFTASFASNLYATPKITQHFMIQFISNGDKAVDTFFAISGFLVAYNVFKGLKKNPKFPVAMYYIHRFIRLTPPIAIACAFYATLAEFLVHGPFKAQYVSYSTEGCRQSWWTDVFYLSNFMTRFQKDDPDKMGHASSCIPQSWYTSVDTQLYILLPIVLLPLYFKGKKGLIWMYFWIATSIAIPAVIIGVYDLYPSLMMTTNVSKSMKSSSKVYTMPWCRATPYLVGTLAGYILHKYPKGEIKLKQYIVIICWSLMSMMAFVIIFCMAPYNRLEIFTETIPADEMSLAFAIIYGSLHRGLWGVWICWIILASHWGYGGIVNQFLSYPALQPISRLTYCIYLTSLGIQTIALSSIKRPVYFTNFLIFEYTSGLIVIIILASLLLNFIAESPILRLEKMFRLMVRRCMQKVCKMDMKIKLNSKKRSTISLLGTEWTIVENRFNVSFIEYVLCNIIHSCNY